MTRAARGRARRSRARRTRLIVVAIATLIVGAIAIVWAAVPSSSPESMDAEAVDWPPAGVAALAHGDQVAVSPGGDTARPIGGLATLITALVVLDRAPLPGGAQGPVFLMTEHDAVLGHESAAFGGISAPVSPGQALTQRQLLAHVLVASSDHLATSLASRIFGSEAGYLAAARAWLDSHGLTEVRIADASGTSAGNTASARDLLTVGRLAAEDPVIAEITAQRVVPGPLGEPLRNTNDLLDLPGVTGLRTGYADGAGHTALFTADLGAGSDPLIGVVLGSPSHAQRSTDVTRLLARARALLP